MPIAVASQEAERHDLKELPGAYVKLRRLMYGEILKRRELFGTFSDRRAQGDGEEEGVEMKMRFFAVQLYEFSHCIVEHNLEKEEGVNLNFANAADLNILDPRVAQEIESLINDMNQPSGEEMAKF